MTQSARLAFVQKIVDRELARLTDLNFPEIPRVVVRVFWESEDDPDLLGEFVGVPLAEFSVDDSGELPPEIAIFTRPLTEFFAGEELEKEIRITLLHELGHAVGLDEDELAKFGLD